MSNKEDISQILLTLKGNYLRLYIKVFNLVILDQNFFANLPSPEIILYTLMNYSRDLFFKYLPIEFLEVIGSDKILTSKIPKLKEMVVLYINIVTNTNKLMLQLKDKGQISNRNNNVLLININRDQYIYELSQCIKSARNCSVYIKNFSTGFNLMDREYKYEKLNIDTTQFFENIYSSQIFEVLTLNFTFQDRMLCCQNIYILAIFNFIGIKLVSIVWDSIGLEFYKKQVFNFEGHPCYYVYPGIDKEFNQSLGLSEIHYFPYFPIKKFAYANKPLIDDFQIICAANSRIENFHNVEKLVLVLAAFDFCRPEEVFYDFQFWFHAVLYFLNNKINLSTFEKQVIRSALQVVYFDGVSILKYEALTGLQTDRRIKLFGDQGWEDLFPEYFQGRYLNKEELYEQIGSGVNLYLLVNDLFSYPESNPVVMHALKSGASFLGFPAVVKVPEIMGFSVVEYRNIEELNKKINSIQDIKNNPKLIASIQSYIQSMESATQGFLNNLTKSKSIQNKNFIHYCERHHTIFRGLVEEYVNRFDDRLQHYILNILIKGDEYKLQISWLYQKPYIQKILKKYGHHVEKQVVPQDSNVSNI